MSPFMATYFDGRRSVPVPVRVTLAADALTLEADGWQRQAALADVSTERPIGGSVWIVLFADGAQLHATETVVMERVSPRRGASRFMFPATPRVSRYVTAFFVVILLAIGAILLSQVHALSALVTRLLPASTEARIGAAALAELDASYCSPSQISQERRIAVLRAWGTLTRELPGADTYRLELRRCPAIGENALAVGGGIAVVTDELLQRVTDDREVAAILAHELGHLQRHHALRSVLENGMRDITLASVLGAMPQGSDLARTLAVAMPRQLIELGYSRDFEREADASAFERLRVVGISPRYFASALRRFRGENGKVTGDRSESPGLSRYFRTHPLDSERIAAAERAAHQ